MKRKNMLMVGVVLIMVLSTIFTVYAQSNANSNHKQTAINGNITVVNEIEQMKSISVKNVTSSFSYDQLKKIGLPDFILPYPNTDFQVFKAENLTASQTGTILSLDGSKGFQLIAGDIVRVYYVSTGNSPNEEGVFEIGYVKNNRQTSLTVGNLAGPCTAWSIEKTQDAGSYEIYFKTEDKIKSNFDVIITIQNVPQIVEN